MTKMVLKTAYTAIAGVDWSSRISKSELVCEVEEKDVTTFASQGWMEYLGGMASGTLGLTFKNDYDAAQVDSVMWGFFGTVQTFEVRPTSAAVGANNPKWTGSVLVKSWAPVNGSPGDVAEADVSWPTSGVVTRAVA